MKGYDNQEAGIFTLLANRRRRILVGYLVLFEPGETVSVRNLARIIRSIETGTSVQSIETDGYESVYNNLIQRHLPKLEEHGVIEYDCRAKQLVTTRSLARYASVLAWGRLQ